MHDDGIGIVSGGRLKLREKACSLAAVLVSIPNNTLLRIRDHNEAWYETIYGTNIGFIMKKHIKLLDMSCAIRRDGRVKDGMLNMRQSDNFAAKCLIQIPDAADIIVIDYDVESLWYIACYEGYTGYVMKEYVVVLQTSNRWCFGNTITEDLNIRRRPGRSAARWNNVWPNNRIAIVKYVNENWYETLYRGEQAFVSAEFINLLDCEVPSDIVQRMLYMVKPEIGRVNSVYFNGYTGQWCHRFADWLAMHAGTPKNLIPNTSNCGKGIVWFVNDAESGGFYFKNAEHKARMIGNYSTIRHLPKELTEEEATYTPSPGDYIYFRWRNAAKDVNVSHVGIVSSVSDDKLTTVEGNAGGAVANRSYALNDDRIVGYGKPKYDAVG